MTQEERLDFLIAALLREQSQYTSVCVPENGEEKRRLFRSLVNVRPPVPASVGFLRVQDEFLREETEKKGITHVEDLTPAGRGVYLWQGDITTLAADGIVNAANSRMLGCFVPCHGCIDNAIHTCAGVQLRLKCHEIMGGREAPCGGAILTEAYNLPSRYILHTVGPVVRGGLTQRHEQALASCYRSCLELAASRQLRSLAFCCISTGEFHFPNQRAAEIAVGAVQRFQRAASIDMKVIFNVFTAVDRDIYRKLLGADSETAGSAF